MITGTTQFPAATGVFTGGSVGIFPYNTPQFFFIAVRILKILPFFRISKMGVWYVTAIRKRVKLII
jgi:hypothetical protein